MGRVSLAGIPWSTARRLVMGAAPSGASRDWPVNGFNTAVPAIGFDLAKPFALGRWAGAGVGEAGSLAISDWIRSVPLAIPLVCLAAAASAGSTG